MAGEEQDKKGPVISILKKKKKKKKNTEEKKEGETSPAKRYNLRSKAKKKVNK